MPLLSINYNIPLMVKVLFNEEYIEKKLKEIVSDFIEMELNIELSSIISGNFISSFDTNGLFVPEFCVSIKLIFDDDEEIVRLSQAQEFCLQCLINKKMDFFPTACIFIKYDSMSYYKSILGLR